MDLYKAIESRRSVRAYLDKPIEADKLERILDAARLAPSGNNRQARKFVVVRDSATRQALANVSGQAFLAKAAVIIAAVCTEERTMTCGVPAGPVDCAIAVEHLALAAVAEGLGTCWIGHFDQKGCREILGVPENATIIEMLTLGYPAETPAPKSRKPMNEVVCYEKYS